jgi:hypothetical protein
VVGVGLVEIEFNGSENFHPRNHIFITKKLAIAIILSDNDRHFFWQLTLKMKQPWGLASRVC